MSAEVLGQDEQAYSENLTFTKLGGTPPWYADAYEAGYREEGPQGALRSLMKAMIAENRNHRMETE